MPANTTSHKAIATAFSPVPVVLLLSLFLSACGFRLAGTTELPPQLASIHLVTDNFSAIQARELRRSLTTAGATLVDATNPEALRLRVSLRAEPDRQLVSSASSGAIVERISRSLTFDVKTADGELVSAGQTLRQQKDVNLDDDNLLSSNREKQAAILELEKSLYQQLVRQLTRI